MFTDQAVGQGDGGSCLGQAPATEVEYGRGWPDLILREAVAGVVLLAVVLALAVLRAPALGEPAMISHPVIEGRLSLAASQELDQARTYRDEAARAIGDAFVVGTRAPERLPIVVDELTAL